MKLGEALIEAGLITRQQLEVALERQAVLGGRIDTNIVELRFLSDEQLTGFLGKYLRLPVATADALSAIPDEVIRIVGKELAENYMIIPLSLERQRLHIAMLNPKNLRDIDNLRFTTGYDIVPCVITEARLFYGLEKYYGIKRDTRYITLKDRFDPDSASEDLSGKIERMSEKAASAGPSEKEAAKYPEAGGTGKVTDPGLIEALLVNAIYTAKLFYAQQGLTADDGTVENEVLANWVRLSGRLRREEEGRPTSRISG